MCLNEAGIQPEEMEDYVNAFKWGMPPHASRGIGTSAFISLFSVFSIHSSTYHFYAELTCCLGLKRLIMLFLKLGNLRNSNLFPRDPQGFPDAPPSAGIHIHNDVQLASVDHIVGFNEPTIASQDNVFGGISSIGGSCCLIWGQYEYSMFF